MSLPTPCLTCGTLTLKRRCEHCTQHQPQPHRTHHQQANTTQRGYNNRWRRLSERARTLQPFCTDCGTTTNLTADHSPEAWERHEAGLPIRLQDIDVVCLTCNLKRGAARGDRSRSKTTNNPTRTEPHDNANRRPDGHTDTRGHTPDESDPDLMTPKGRDNYFPWKVIVGGGEQ